MMAAEHAEGLHVACLQQQLIDKQSALKLSSVHLQELQARHRFLLRFALRCCHRHCDNVWCWAARSAVPVLLPGLHARLADVGWLIHVCMYCYLCCGHHECHVFNISALTDVLRTSRAATHKLNVERGLDRQSTSIHVCIGFINICMYVKQQVAACMNGKSGCGMW